MFVVLMLAALVSAAPKPTKVNKTTGVVAAETADSTAKAVKVFQVDPSKKLIRRIQLVPNVSTVIQFPEAWVGSPTCGNCVFGDSKYEGQLFRIDLLPETHAINLKMARLPGPDAPAEGFVTNLDVTLEGGATVSFFAHVVPNPDEADSRIEIVLPAHATSQARMSAKERELTAAFDARVAAAANELQLAGLMHGTECKGFWGSPRRTDNLVVRMRQICRNGNALWVVFDVENNGRDDVHLVDAILAGDNGTSSTTSKFEKAELFFQSKTRGVAVISLAAADAPAARYTLQVRREGSDSVVQIEDMRL